MIVPAAGDSRSLPVDKDHGHHWMIETQDGPTSSAIYRTCGDKRHFENGFSNSITFRKAGAATTALANTTDQSSGLTPVRSTMHTLTKNLSAWTTQDVLSEVLSRTTGDRRALDQIQATMMRALLKDGDDKADIAATHPA